MPVDYSKFDRLVARSEEEDRRQEEAQAKAQEERLAKDKEELKYKELQQLRSAEDLWRSSTGSTPAKQADAETERVGQTAVEAKAEKDQRASAAPSEDDALLQAAKQSTKSKAAGKDFESMSQTELEDVDVDEFFRLLSEEEKAEKRKLKEEKLQRQRERDEASGKRPLQDSGMTPEQTAARIAHLEADHREMMKLMERSDRPSVKARLGEFVVELGNDLARLKADPLELDDEDRRELRLFQLRRLQLPGAARARQELTIDEATNVPRALVAPDLSGAVGAASHWEEPWRPVTTFGLELGEAASPYITVDVRLEAVERLPLEAVECHFTEDSFDLQIRHELEGAKYRLVKTCLHRDIETQKSSFRIKRNHVIVTLAKVLEHAEGKDQEPAEYLPWMDLCASDRQSRNPALRRKVAPPAPPQIWEHEE